MSNLVHWSYQSTAPCSVLVDEESNELGSPSSQSNLVHRNQSISHRTKPASGGNKRFRRSADEHGDDPVDVVHDNKPLIGEEHDPLSNIKNFSRGFGFDSLFSNNLSVLNNSNISSGDGSVDISVMSSEVDSSVDGSNGIEDKEESTTYTPEVSDLMEMTTVVYDLSPEEKEEMRSMQADDPFADGELIGMGNNPTVDIAYEDIDDPMMQELEKIQAREEKREEARENREEKEEEIKENIDHEILMKEVDSLKRKEQEKKLLLQQQYLKEKERELLLSKVNNPSDRGEENKVSEEDDTLTLKERELLKKEREIRVQQKEVNNNIMLFVNASPNSTNTSNSIYTDTNTQEFVINKEHTFQNEKQEIPSYQVMNENNFARNNFKPNRNVADPKSSSKPVIHLLNHERIYLSKMRKKLSTTEDIKPDDNHNDITSHSLDAKKSTLKSHNKDKNENFYKSSKKITKNNQGKDERILKNTNSNIGKNIQATHTNNTLIDLTHSINNNNRLFINVSISTDGMLNSTNQLSNNFALNAQSGDGNSNNNRPLYFLSLVLPTNDGMSSNSVSSHVQLNTIPKFDTPDQKNVAQSIENVDTNGTIVPSTKFTSADIARNVLLSSTDRATSLGYLYGGECQCSCPDPDGKSDIEEFLKDWDETTESNDDIVTPSIPDVTTSTASSELTTVESSTIPDMSSTDDTATPGTSPFLTNLANNRSLDLRLNTKSNSSTTAVTSSTEVWDDETESTSSTTTEATARNTTGCPKIIPPPVLYIEGKSTL